MLTLADGTRANEIAMRMAALLGIRDCQVEVGRVGFVVYGPSPERTNAASRAISKFLTKELKKNVVLEAAIYECDEEPESAWIATVRFTW